MKMIFLQDVDLNASPVVRSEIREDVVADYAALYKQDKNALPAIDVFTPDGKTYLIGDGWHRLKAMLSIKLKAAGVNVVSGGYEDALKFALTSNVKHGIRRSNADKRQCVQQAIKQWPKHSDNHIATACSVDNHTVSTVRKAMEGEGEVAPEPIRRTASGTVRSSQNSPPGNPRGTPGAIGNSQSENSQVPANQPTKKEVLDNTGYVIPKFALQYWSRADEVKALINQINAIKRFLKEREKEQDLLYAEVNFSAAIADLDKVWNNVMTAVPHVVCTTCQGHPASQPKGECRLCKGRGLISKFRYDTAVPSEVKALKGKK